MGSWNGKMLNELRVLIYGLFEPAPTSAPFRMNDKWSGNSFLAGSSSLANNYRGWLTCFSSRTYQLTTHKEVVRR
jgi:hypothetical protein